MVVVVVVAAASASWAAFVCGKQTERSCSSIHKLALRARLCVALTLREQDLPLVWLHHYLDSHWLLLHNDQTDEPCVRELFAPFENNHDTHWLLIGSTSARIATCG